MKKISRKSEYAHSTKDKRVRLVGICRKVPLVAVAFYLAGIFEKVSFDPYNFRITRISVRKSEQMKIF